MLSLERTGAGRAEEQGMVVPQPSFDASGFRETFAHPHDGRRHGSVSIIEELERKSQGSRRLMFAVVPLDSPLHNWLARLWPDSLGPPDDGRMRLVAGLAVVLITALLAAVAIWFWRRAARRRAEPGETRTLATAARSDVANRRTWQERESFATRVAEAWDRVREQNAAISALLLLVLAVLAAVRWWTGDGARGGLGDGASGKPSARAVNGRVVDSRATVAGKATIEPWVPGGDWPTDRGSAARLGSVGASAGPRHRPPRLVWRFGRPDEAFYASPAVSGNRVYAVGSEGARGRVVALDLATGKLAWSGGPPGMRATFSSPVIAGGKLFCGEGLHATRDARLFALSLEAIPATNSAAGRLAWSFSTRSHIECTPTVVAEPGGQPARMRVFFQAGDDGVYAVSSDRAGIAFHKAGAEFPDAETALLVDGGVVYCGLGQGGSAVVLVDAATGRERERLATAWPVFAPPAASGSAVFVGMGDADFANPAAGNVGDSGRRDGEDRDRDARDVASKASEVGERPAQRRRGGAVWRLARGTARVEWRRALPGAVLGVVACADGSVVAGCGDGRVYSIAGDNSAMRSWSTGGPLSAPLAVAGDFVYGVNHRGWLFAIDRRAAGESPLWRWRLGEPGPYVSGPVVAGQRLVVGTPGEGLVCVEPADDSSAELRRGL